MALSMSITSMVHRAVISATVALTKANKGYGSIAHEAKPNGSNCSNCFSITQLVGQKKK